MCVFVGSCAAAVVVVVVAVVIAVDNIIGTATLLSFNNSTHEFYLSCVHIGMNRRRNKKKSGLSAMCSDQQLKGSDDYYYCLYTLFAHVHSSYCCKLVNYSTKTG